MSALFFGDLHIEEMTARPRHIWAAGILAIGLESGGWGCPSGGRTYRRRWNFCAWVVCQVGSSSISHGVLFGRGLGEALLWASKSGVVLINFSLRLDPGFFVAYSTE
jgi:hypothetical protein